MVYQFYDNLEVFDTSLPDWKDMVLNSLGSREPFTIVPLLNILNLAEHQGVKTVIREANYIDADFLDEFRKCYSGHFSRYEPRCNRLHFFREPFNKSDLPDISLVDQGYLGFSVVRPLCSFCTGRTIMVSPRHDGHSMYTTCMVKFEANIAGNKLTSTGMPFIQQDTNVSVCAEAALWMTSLYMHQKFGFARFKPSEVTMAATRSLTVGPVRSGLTSEQVLAALREMGYAPLIFTHHNLKLTGRIVYAYIESELPVILLIQNNRGGHAIVVIGHDFHYRRCVKRSWDSNIHWIDRFYIHDDAVGPYQEMRLRGRTRHSDQYSLPQHVRYVIVPVPPTITMQADDVFDHVATLMDHLNDILGIFGQAAQGLAFTSDELKGLVFRTYLRSSSEFQNQLSADMSSLFQHRYKSMAMPRYIWVTEVSNHNLINRHNVDDRRIIGEIIIDSTADRHAHMRSYLAIHLFGRMIVRRPPHTPSDPQVQELFIDPAEVPYGHLVR